MNGLTSTVANLYHSFEPDIKITPAKGKYIIEDDILFKQLKQVPGVKLISRTLSDKAFIKNADKQSIVTVKGADSFFNKVTQIDSAITEGRFDFKNKAKKNMVLGRGVANQLQVTTGEFASDLSLFSPIKGKTSGLSAEEQVKQDYFRPGGIFSLNDEFDFKFVFVDFDVAAELFQAKGKISAFEILCDENQTESAQEKLKELLGSDYVIKNRYQLNDVLFKSLETEKLATFIILAFILIIATFNIIGALTMLIIEKKKDIKTLYSLGADVGLVRNIFMREGFLITGIGAVLGLFTGLLVCWLQVQFHLVKFGEEFIIPYYPIELRWGDFLKILALIMFIGFVAALYPVRLFTRMEDRVY